MRTLARFAAPALLCVPLAAQMAAGNVADGNAYFRYGSFPTSSSSTSGSADFKVTGSGGTDNLWDIRWMWRLSTDPNEYVLHNDTVSQAAPSSSYAGNTAVFTWPNVDNRNFAAVHLAEVFSSGGTAGAVVHRLTMTNNTNGPVMMNLFAYVDIDQCSSIGSNSAMANPTNDRVAITAGACAAAEVYAPGSDLYEVGAFPTVRDKLLNAAFDNLANAGLPFGPGDFTGAWQWKDRPLPAGGSLTVYVVIGEGGFSHTGCIRSADASTTGPIKPGANGPAAFDTTIRPFLGRAATLKLDNGFGGAQPVYLFGVTPTSFPFPPFGTVLVDPSTAIILYGTPFDALLSSSTPMPIPNAPALCGGSVLFQAFWLDPGAAGGIAHSNRLRWLLGGLN